MPIMFVAIILTFILPIPSLVLDVLLAFNIVISAIIMIDTVYLKEPLQLSIFPSLIVITTLYRLSLNVATTKLILGKGDAGGVIRGFGEFVAQGNIVVGFLMFLIIMIVNFLVITKGAERVAEVAARFTLDAMPGKQMAIDADLNTGLINEQQARERRSKIQKEADFYGSMDGASKFVKNDAIAGIIITLLNIIGGLIIGMAMRGDDLNYALNTYTILTIGDGLVSQIPALMISTATSLVVTRAAASESDISHDLLKQVFMNPKVMYIASALSVFLSLFLSTLPFLLMGGILFFIGYMLSKQQKEAMKKEEEHVEEQEVEEIRKPESVVGLLQVDPIELEFGYSIIPLADVNQGGDLLDRVVMIRRQLALELGIIVPIIRLRDNIQLKPDEYVVKIRGVEVARGDVMADRYMAMDPGDAEGELEGIDAIEPAFGLPTKWIDETQRERAEMLGYTIVDAPSVIATHLTEVIRRHAHEFLGRQEVKTLIENVKQTNPAVVEELVPKLLSFGEVQKILANLLKEGVSIRDMVTILETLADYAPMTTDTDVLTEYVRQALGRAISRKYLAYGNHAVLTLDPALEQLIMESVKKTETGSYLTMDPKVASAIIDNLSKHVEKLLSTGNQPVVLASPIVRLYFKRLTQNTLPDLAVLSYNELEPNLEVKPAGVISA